MYIYETFKLLCYVLVTLGVSPLGIGYPPHRRDLAAQRGEKGCVSMETPSSLLKK